MSAICKSLSPLVQSDRMRDHIAIANKSRFIDIKLAAMLACLIASCSPSQDQTDLVPLAESQAETVQTQGVSFQAMVYDDPALTAAVFSADIRDKGLLPLRFTLQNRSIGAVKIIPRQTFLINQAGLAWPLLTAEQAFLRLGLGTVVAQLPSGQPSPKVDGSFTAFAVDLVAGSAGTHSAHSLYSGKNLHNPEILPGQVASGIFMFPGRQEIHAVRGLRICVEMSGRLAFVTLPLKTSTPLASNHQDSQASE